MNPEKDSRRSQALLWAAELLKLPGIELHPVSGDASFRRYFRIQTPGRSLILMDAPPEKENSAPFVDIAERLRAAGLNAPEIVAFDLDTGFGLLEDFGDILYREIISPRNVETVFPALFDVLEGLARHVDSQGLPNYDRALLLRDMELFTDWYLAREKHIKLTERQQLCWKEMCQQLVQSAQAQPQVFVHRDFHSCNLLQTPQGPGVIDFQDGLRGPLSYDLASLLWDRYIAWPRDQLEAWMREFHQRLRPDFSIEQWIRYCDWIGLQRNLKIVGIFARLHHRDNKAGYREMIPQFYRYVTETLSLYPEFDDFSQLLEDQQCAP